MSQELLYTSAPRGLKPGSRGFCTVLSTQGMAAPLATALEGLSGYRPIYPAGDALASRNPVVHSHLKLQCAGRVWHVLSRIADFGLDYSQRANKLAHHVVLEKTELLAGGPANLLGSPGVLRANWEGEPKVVGLKPVTREATPPSGVCRAWGELTGDAGWAGILAESFLRDSERLVILLFAPGQDLLPLFAEAISLLPPERRWDVTFSTYFTGLATGTTCVWRALIHDSKEARDSIRFVNALRVDLTSGSLGPATGGTLVNAARSGVRPYQAKPPSLPMTSPVDEEFAGAHSEQVEFSPADNVQVEFAEAESADSRGRPPIPQSPPRLVPGRATIPLQSTVNPKRRRLADVIAEESNRRPSRRWIWITLTAIVLLIATSFGIGLCVRPDWQANVGVGFERLVRLFNKPSNEKDLVAQADPQTKEVPSVKPTTPEVPVTATANKPQGPTVVGDTPRDGADSSPPIDDQPKEKMTEKTDPPAPGHAPSVAPDSTSKVSADAVAPKLLPTLQHEVVELPAKEKPQVKLHSIAASAVGNPPRMLLLKPSWLHYTDGEPTPAHKKEYSAQRAITFPTDNASIPIALFTVIADKEDKAMSWFKLKSLLDDHTRWLGWYRIRVLSPNSHEPPLKELSFTHFPMDEEATRKRNFGESMSIEWKLPTTALVDGSHLPKLILDRLIVTISGVRRSVDVTPLVESSTWKVSLAEFASATYLKLGVNSQGASPLAVTLEVNADKAAIELKLSGKIKFLKLLEDVLTKSLFELKSDLTAQSGIVDLDLKQSVEYQFKGVSVTSNSGKEELLVVAPSIGEKIAKLRAGSKNNKDDARDKALDAVDSGLSRLDVLFKRIVEFHRVAKSLDSVEITSVRIYYVLKDTRKGSDLSVEVDVVNFGDTAKGDGKQEPAATKEAKP